MSEHSESISVVRRVGHGSQKQDAPILKDPAELALVWGRCHGPCWTFGLATPQPQIKSCDDVETCVGELV